MFFRGLRVLARKFGSPNLAAQRKSLRKFNLLPLATACRSVWPGLKARYSRPVGDQIENVFAYLLTKLCQFE